jgi:hypothetical protein
MISHFAPYAQVFAYIEITATPLARSQELTLVFLQALIADFDRNCR